MVDFKFKLSNLPKYITPERVQTAAAELLGVAPTTVSARKRAHSDLAFVTVAQPEGDSTASTQNMLARLNEGRIEGAKVIAVEDTFVAQQKDRDSHGGNKKMKLKAPDKKKILADQVTSLWRLTYPEQLTMKKESLLKALDPLLKKATENVSLEDVLPSPITTGYRNKVEYTFGVNRELKQTVGLCLGGFLNGSHAVDSPDGLLHIPASLIALANHMQKFMDEHPELPVWNVISKTGFWRLLLCRIHGDNQLLVGLQLNEEMPEGIDKEEILNKIVAHFKEFEHEGTEIASFQLQWSSGAHSGLDMKKPFTVLFGQDYVKERLGPLQFKVSPLSFFQNNIPATIVLYDTVKELATSEESANNVLLDLCCGTGTIGMYLQDRFRRVVGVELVPEAIADAKENAIANRLSDKCTYICARVEDAIDSLLKDSSNGKMTVVLDPPRAGCSASVIAAVRKCEAISRVVFVACEAALSAHNMVALIDGGVEAGRPFKVTRMQPVDLFPHTPHCELVVQFDRD